MISFASPPLLTLLARGVSVGSSLSSSIFPFDAIELRLLIELHLLLLPELSRSSICEEDKM